MNPSNMMGTGPRASWQNGGHREDDMLVHRHVQRVRVHLLWLVLRDPRGPDQSLEHDGHQAACLLEECLDEHGVPVEQRAHPVVVADAAGTNRQEVGDDGPRGLHAVLPEGPPLTGAGARLPNGAAGSRPAAAIPPRLPWARGCGCTVRQRGHGPRPQSPPGHPGRAGAATRWGSGVTARGRNPPQVTLGARNPARLPSEPARPSRPPARPPARPARPPPRPEPPWPWPGASPPTFARRAPEPWCTQTLKAPGGGNSVGLEPRWRQGYGCAGPPGC